MQRLPRQQEFLCQRRRPSLIDKVQIVPRIRPVDFVADNAVSHPLRVRANLMLPARFGHDLNPCKSTRRRTGCEMRDRFLPVFGRTADFTNTGLPTSSPSG